MERNDAELNISTDFIDRLSDFGLSEEEGRVFLSLIKRGPRGEVVGRIKDELDIGRTTIYAIMERLKEKRWVDAEEISTKPRRVKYMVKEPYKTLNGKITKKEQQLKQMKKSILFMGDSLEKAYQGARKLSIDTIHPGAYKYLRPLVQQDFKIKTEVIEHSEGDIYRISYDYELKGPTGTPKDCGLIIFEYNDNIENKDDLINSVYEMFKEKTEYEIRKDKIPGFEDVKLEEKKIEKYLGTEVLIKLKFKKKWWKAGYQVVIPLKNKIFLLFGNETNFRIIMDVIVKSEEFRHLV